MEREREGAREGDATEGWSIDERRHSMKGKREGQLKVARGGDDRFARGVKGGEKRIKGEARGGDSGGCGLWKTQTEILRYTLRTRREGTGTERGRWSAPSPAGTDRCFDTCSSRLGGVA